MKPKPIYHPSGGNELPKVDHSSSPRPIAPWFKVVSIAQGECPPTCRLGFMAGQIKMPEGFNTLGQEEIGRLFLGAHETAA